MIKKDIKEVKTIEDVFNYMKENIEYGYIDINGKKHIKDLKGFRKIYRIASVEESIENGLGTCIEQVALMNYLCTKNNLETKMYCTRIYEPNNFNDMEAEEHMHCFLLVFKDDKVYHIEHPNWYNMGIFEYKNEKEAIKVIQKYFIDLSGGAARPLTQLYEIKPGLTFGEFNNYINSLKEIK